MTCEHCGESVNIVKAGGSLRYVTRDANDRDPQTFLIIGSDAGLDALLHRCIIPESSDQWTYLVRTAGEPGAGDGFGVR